MVTAGTLRKEHFYQGDDRLELLQTALREVLAEFHWALQAWAVFSNHSISSRGRLQTHNSSNRAIQKLHSVTARGINRRDEPTLGGCGFSLGHLPHIRKKLSGAPQLRQQQRRAPRLGV